MGQQSTTRNVFSNKYLRLTECSGTAGSSFATDLKWNLSNIIIGSTRNRAKGTILWHLAFDPRQGPPNGSCTTCRGVVTIDDNTGTVAKKVEYYVIAGRELTLDYRSDAVQTLTAELLDATGRMVLR